MARKSVSRRGRTVVQRPSVQKLREIARLAVVRGDFDAAERAYRSAIQMGSMDGDVYNNLASILNRRGANRAEEAALLEKAYELSPDHAGIHANYLRSLDRELTELFRADRFREALPIAQRRVELAPELAQAQRDLGFCYWKTGKPEDGIKYLTRAINISPDNESYYNELGLMCFELRLLPEAQGAFQEVLRLNPRSVVAFTHLGLLANLTGLTGLAIGFLRRALAIDPNCSAAQNNIALFLRDQGEQTECRRHYEEAIRLSPQNANMFSGYLLALNDDPTLDPAWIAEQHRRFQSLISPDVRDVQPVDRNPNRRLRVGYLSPDFRMHSVAFFIAPVLQAHDRDAVEVFCYFTGFAEDAMTASIQESVSTFRKVYRMADDDLLDLIKSDQIDILVELSGHTSENRLIMLGRRAAPIQVTYLGYPNTTGLTQMDYRVTDPIADPVGMTEALHTEKLARIDGGFLAYQPMPAARQLPVADLPARETGYVTFGSFNNLGKINDLVLDTWANILEQVPGSRMLLKARGLRTDHVKERVSAAFAARGVDAEKRVELMGHARSSLEHLQVYNRVDLALDTFPYNGTTTTCEALWMGTPVVSFHGRSHAGRVGASILTNCGLTELVANDRDEYIQRAVSLGNDLDRLATIRSGLRERFATSPVTDSIRLARALERFFREAWQSYCLQSSQ